MHLLHKDGARFGKGSIGWCFGFTLYALLHRNSTILSAVLTPANWDEHDRVLALALSVEGGIVLADLGYRSWDDELT
jgi:hypothetical protein